MNSSCIGCKCVLPILIYIETIERSFAADIFEGDVGNIARTAGIRLDKGDIITCIIDILRACYVDWMSTCTIKYLVEMRYLQC